MWDLHELSITKGLLYFLTKIILISIAVFLLLQTALVIIDSRQNGFTTLSLHTNLRDLSKNSNNYSFIFKANEDYLGSLSLPLPVHQNANVIFKIKEENASSWYFQSTYSTDGIGLLPIYPFGFSVIGNSKNKLYQVVIGSANFKKSLISLDASNIIPRYSYPRNILFHNKKLLISFLFEKYITLVSFSTIFISFIIALFLFNPKIAVKKIKNF